MIHLRWFFSRGQNVLAVLITGLFVLTAIAAPLIAPPDDPDDASGFRRVGRSTQALPQPPSAVAPLGTARGQLDVFYTLIWGTRNVLRFGLVVASITAIVGVSVGAVSGYVGGPIGGLAMRVTDAFLTFPPIAGIWLLRQVMLPSTVDTPPTAFQQFLIDIQLDPVMLTLILFSWMPYARLINANVARLKGEDYITAARALGVSTPGIVVRHVLPNAISPAIVLAARDVGGMVILESAFTFIGVGGTTEWGQVLAMSRDYIIGTGGDPLRYWWVFVPISTALILFGIGWNLLGDGLNTMLSPKTAQPDRIIREGLTTS